ncbi:peptidase domain-containing ABC transporter [Olivibacter sp. SDN3]|uniref:peptidase domain-containing ABC transporter n=1 Tax=Olivibacter sp. SDN3 TaxID=2764720 RepID=UPI00165154AA|nr:peptidase domain-containing ABC transporter [Olivibacter sp. SDN3]QNL48168.1 peptidase domain-containing ABC transporter [Olivibacter sp. SDN3]
MGIKIKQRDISDCGAACLASVAAKYKLNLPIARIRQMAGTDKKGTNVLGIVEAAAKIGITAKGVKGPFESLSKVSLPAIAHVVIKNVLQHYVVIYKVTPQYIEIMDPADGKMHKKTPEEFKAEWTGILILLAPNESFKQGNEKISTRSRFWQLIKPHRTVLTQALVGAILYTILGLSTALFVQKIVDFVLADGNRNLLNLMGVIMISILLVKIMISIFKTIFTIKTGQAIDANLILGYYKHLTKLPQSFFDNMRVGEIIARVNDAVKIRVFINDVSLNFLVNIFIVVFSFALMFTWYWKLAVIVLLVIPLYGIIYYITNRLNKKVQRRMMEEAAELESQLVESINAMGTIKRFGLEQHANLKTEVRFVTLLKTIYRSGLNSLFSVTSTEFISQLFTIVLLWVGAGYVLDVEITPGELLSFYALIGYFTGPASTLIGMNKTIQDAAIAADRLFEIMDLEQEDNDRKLTLTAENLGDIIFDKVSFRYGTRILVFDNLGLHIRLGKLTAIVGESGSGKSTLLSLLQNIYPIAKGNIYIGEHALKYIDNESLRKVIGVVPQQIDLFTGNVIENIAIGDYEPDMQRIIAICKRLGILPFIESLPNGFHTYLGENGASLSGGQKQRIAIARALYKQPEVLILDEATSSLDPAAEQYVQQTIHYLRDQGKTVILIAHRLSTVQTADKIIVLQQGKLVEEGTHASLMASEGKYYNLWQQQMPVVGGS